jgi:hypothetical protein
MTEPPVASPTVDPTKSNTNSGGDGGVLERTWQFVKRPLAAFGRFLKYSGDKLVIPLLLAGVAFALGPYISQHWQDHHAEISTKASIVQNVSLASAELMSAVETRDTHPELETTSRYYADFRTWQDASQEIQGQIASYFPSEATLRTDWIRFTTALRLYHALPDQPKDREPRRQTLAALYAYANTFNNIAAATAKRFQQVLAAKPPKAAGNLLYQAAWRRLGSSLIAQRDAFVAEVVHSNGFSG